ncbi:DUF4862 family protein [Lacisediminihabitans profunda]|uniref:DUF4862 family protein n=1 Tax=Lacisediminihabitans profunda TaxID=2594790 RepID=A0A5C8UP09_9MICO|nr:DUF4862 family protein [Lacisediminihabitans profunda]TXN29973.1 DUF4862 family protein [Lacisediminihabitans profunda]
MIDGITLGAYALEPAADVLTVHENKWYAALAAIDGAHGLEIPYRGGLHRDGVVRLGSLLPTDWHVVITMLPPTMAGIRADAAYGLASTDDGGRAAALADVRAALEQARRLDEVTDRRTVRAIHLASAPRGGGDPGRLALSLTELAADAHGIALLLEHCDAWTAARPVEKGFLPLEAEIAAVLAARPRTDATIGQVINWGRSAIDGRSPDSPVAQLAALESAGTLAGFMVSGASATGGPLGAAWADAHNPVATVDPSSLLTVSAIAAALTASVASRLEVLGVKVQDPRRATEFDAHLQPLRATVAPVLERITEVSR